MYKDIQIFINDLEKNEYEIQIFANNQFQVNAFCLNHLKADTKHLMHVLQALTDIGTEENTASQPEF